MNRWDKTSCLHMSDYARGQKSIYVHIQLQLASYDVRNVANCDNNSVCETQMYTLVQRKVFIVHKALVNQHDVPFLMLPGCNKPKYV